MDAEYGVLLAGAFVCGAVVGSFANVCIHRLPLDESVVSPPSRCPSCRRRIAFYDNVPVVSWLLLRGRCRWCHATIPARYPLVEALVGTLFALAFIRYGLTGWTVAAAVLSAAAVILVATDAAARVLPDEVTFGALCLGLLLGGARDLAARTSAGGFRWGDSFLLNAAVGAALGGALLQVVRKGYEALRGQEGMGAGDVKMIAMIGSLTGPAGVLLTLFFGSLSGAVLGIGAVLAQRLRWVSARRVLGSDQGPDTRPAGFVHPGLRVDAGGRVVEAGPRWSEIPEAARPGDRVSSSGPVARPAAAFVRLALRRARSGRTSEYRRLVLDDGGDFFRVLAARGEPSADGGVVVYLSRADIPFGVFLAVGSLAAFVAGRTVLTGLFLDDTIPGTKLLP